MDNDLADDELLDSLKEIWRKISDTELSEIEDFTLNSPFFKVDEEERFEYLCYWREIKIYVSELLVHFDLINIVADWEFRIRLIISRANYVLDYDHFDDIYKLTAYQDSFRTRLSEFYALLNPFKGN